MNTTLTLLQCQDCCLNIDTLLRSCVLTQNSLNTDFFNYGIYPFIPWGGRVVRWYWVNFQCRGVLLFWIIVGHGPTALAVGASGGY